MYPRKKRRKLPKKKRPRAAPLEIGQILAWADDHHRRTGQWPHKDLGKVVGGIGDNWRSIDNALRYGAACGS